MSIYTKVRDLKHIASESVIFTKGYREFQRTHKTPVRSYHSLRGLYCMTNGRFNDAVSWLLSWRHPTVKIPAGPSVVGDFSGQDLARVVRDIDVDGFHVFDRKLSPETIRSLRSFAETIPSRAIGGAAKAEAGQRLSPYKNHPVEAPKYDIRQQDLLANGTVQKLMMDPGLFRVAQGFLRCAPIIDLVAMWWSRPFHGQASTEAAQLFHFDMDRVKFLKFFFYLTDVTTNTGPHCYVRGSSKRKPPAILRDGRIADDEIRAHYKEQDIVEISGETGSIIAVDTRGWHKGKPLTENERLILQIEFTNSNFGQNYEKADLSKFAGNPFFDVVRANPRMFEGIIA